MPTSKTARQCHIKIIIGKSFSISGAISKAVCSYWEYNKRSQTNHFQASLVSPTRHAPSFTQYWITHTRTGEHTCTHSPEPPHLHRGNKLISDEEKSAFLVDSKEKCLLHVFIQLHINSVSQYFLISMLRYIFLL